VSGCHAAGEPRNKGELIVERTSGSVTRRTALGSLAGGGFLASLASKLSAAKSSVTFPSDPLISIWEHAAKVDIAPVIKDVGFNTVWTHDKPCDSSTKLEDTLMYRHMNTPGVKYVIAKVERGIWGWSFDQAMRHAEWIAKTSLDQNKIIGVYLNDFYEEMEEIAKGGHSEKEFREIIGKIKTINPRLAIWVPCYPPRELEKSYDFDVDAIIFSFYNTKILQDHSKLLDQALQKFKGKPVMGSLYLNSGSEGRWLLEEEFKQLTDFFVAGINDGKLCGLRVFRVASLQERPEYAKWTKESLANLRRT
jgi:hypothetical protein